MKQYKFQYLRIKIHYRKQQQQSKRIQLYILSLWKDSLNIKGKIELNIKYPMLLDHYNKTFRLIDRLERIY